MLPELQGSPKQVSWAKRIRTERLNSWEKPDPEIFKDIETALNNETSAAWWITHREKELGEVIKFIQGGTTGKAPIKPPKASIADKASSSDSSPSASFTDLDDIHRCIGVTRNIHTGEVASHDPECPF